MYIRPLTALHDGTKLTFNHIDAYLMWTKIRKAYVQTPGSAIIAAVGMHIAMKISLALSNHQEMVRHSLDITLVDISKPLTGRGKYDHQTQSDT